MEFTGDGGTRRRELLEEATHRVGGGRYHRLYKGVEKVKVEDGHGMDVGVIWGERETWERKREYVSVSG